MVLAPALRLVQMSTTGARDVLQMLRRGTSGAIVQAIAEITEEMIVLAKVDERSKLKRLVARTAENHSVREVVARSRTRPLQMLSPGSGVVTQKLMMLCRR